MAKALPAPPKDPNDRALVPVPFGSYRRPSLGASGPAPLPGAEATAAPPDDAANHAKLEREAEQLGTAVGTYLGKSIASKMATCRSICLFFYFLIMFTTVMLLEQSWSSSRLADHIRGKLEGGPVPLESVSSVTDLYDYLETAFVPAMYENSSDTNMALELSRFFHPMDVSNRIVGGVRLRQARVKYTEGCQMTPLFEKYTIKCYPAFTGESESRDSFGPDGKFKFSKDDKGSNYQGAIGSYSPHGFMEVLPSSVSSAMDKLKELRTDRFMGPWTRALFIDFTVWSSNIGTYAVVTVAVEFGASGMVSSRVDILMMTERSISALGLGSATDVVAFIGMLIVMCWAAGYMVEEYLELKNGVVNYFSDGWNVMDWTNLLLLWVAFGIRIGAYVTASQSKIGIAELQNKDAFQNLRMLAEMVELVKLLHAFNAVLLWLKVVKYFRHVPVIKDLINAVWDALELLVPFLCMFMVAFVGFAMSYNIGFGDKILELSTFGRTLVYLCRAFLRDVKLMPSYAITPFFGAILILSFYVTFLLVSVNVLLAIMADAMLRAKDEKSKRDKENAEFWQDVANALRMFLKKRAPKAYKKLYRGKKSKVDQRARPVEAMKDFSKTAELVDPDEVESINSFDSPAQQKLPSREDLMRAIEHMSGRILSEVSIVGIEIKSELHDVCERVAQMQMAVEELSLRTDAVRMEQDDVVQST